MNQIQKVITNRFHLSKKSDACFLFLLGFLFLSGIGLVIDGHQIYSGQLKKSERAVYLASQIQK